MKKVILAAILVSFSVFTYAQSATSTSTSTSTSTAKAKMTDSAKPAAKPAEVAKPASKPAEAPKLIIAPAPAPVKPAEAAKPAVKPADATKPVDTAKTTAKPATGVKKDKDVFTMEVYGCPKHEKMESSKPGKCTYCHSTLVKELRSYTYKCKVCGYSSDKEGNCPIDKNVKLKKFRVVYRCVPDNILENSPGICEKCGQPLKRVDILLGK